MPQAQPAAHSGEDSVVRIWRPNRSEPRPPLNPTSEHCTDCKKRRFNLTPWTERIGTAKENIEFLLTLSDWQSCVEWFESISTIAWSKEDELLLCRAYVDHASKTYSRQHWGSDNAQRKKALQEEIRQCHAGPRERRS